MPLSDGTRLGRYEIRSKIGAGGMGEVYLTHDAKLDRKVALKILAAEVATHPDRMKRFMPEAKTASALNHPGIITIYEIEEIDSVSFIATEFIDGETLRECMRGAPLKVGAVLEVAIQTASALQAPHSKLLQLLVFFLRFNENRQIGVRILPAREEILILLARFLGVTCEHGGARQSEARQRIQNRSGRKPSAIQKLRAQTIPHRRFCESVCDDRFKRRR